MLPANASAPGAKAPVRGDLLAEYAEHLARSGRGHCHSEMTARSFLRRWPDPQRWAAQPLADRLAESPQTSSFLIFLMVHGYLRPGYDYLVARKLTSFWRDIAISPLEADMARFRRGAEAVGFTPI